MRVEIHENLENLQDIQNLWNEYCQSPQFHSGGYYEYAALEDQSNVVLQLVILCSGSNHRIIAPFFQSTRKKSFSIGERHLFSLTVDTLILYSQWMMQHGSESEIVEIFRALESKPEINWIDLGEIPVGSILHRALDQLDRGWIVSERSRKLSMRWLIDLPNEYDGYLQSLNPKTRQSTKRKIRKLERKYEIDLKVIKDVTDIDYFLREGEKISRKTYQWNVGQKLCDDEETRSRYISLCERGQLRCYLLYVNGQPGAFLRGTITNDMYDYETPGYDPVYRNDSMGTVMLMYAIRDIIENTSCRVFDFGVGGDESGYKSTYGTRSVQCTYIELGRRGSFHANVIAAIQFSLNKTKNAASHLLGQGNLRQKIKRSIRRSG